VLQSYFGRYFANFNVYFPCAGTDNRLFICYEIISNVMYWISKYPEYRVIVGGDINCELSSISPVLLTPSL